MVYYGIELKNSGISFNGFYYSEDAKIIYGKKIK